MDIAGVYLWQASRMHIYYLLAESAGLYHPPHVAHHGITAWLGKLKFLARAITLENPFLKDIHAETVIFPHTRSRACDGRQIDVYSDYLCRALVEKHNDVMIFERPFLNEYVMEHSAPNCRVGMIDSIASIVANLGVNPMSHEDQDRVKALEAALQEKTGIALNLLSIFSRQLRRFRIRRKLYGMLLDRCGATKVYIVVSYYLSPLIAACKERGIPVFELQHGIISAYHLGYSFPGRAHGSLQYFPDYLLEWAGKWPGTKHLPLDAQHRIEYGFPYFEHNAAKHSGVRKVPKSVLIVSQTVHGDDLARFILDNIDKFAGWHITYKLHPSEINRAGAYEALGQLAKVACHFDLSTMEDVHALLARSQAVVGVFSTVLYEALAFGCAVYVCPLSGWEYMEENLENGEMLPFENFRPEMRDGVV
tara:strand:- start:39417 stop:40679 length:1263 start_codon:yes stop_codon:yes gene_type:complete